MEVNQQLNANKLFDIMQPCVYRVLVTTFSFFAILPISKSGYEKGCFVAVSVFLLSKIMETFKIQSKYKNLHKHMAPVLSANIIFSVLSMYLCWGFGTIFEKCGTTIALFVIIAWALFISVYDYYDLYKSVNSYLILDEHQKKAKNNEV